jgi:hypothetical protein
MMLKTVLELVGQVEKISAPIGGYVEKACKEIARRSRGLVEEALATDGAAEAGNTVGRVHFALEFVVIREFLVY